MTQPKCYLCGAPNPDTEDHVPPTGFFPPPRPSNLIRLPCCKACNNGYSLDDEAFRVFVTAPEEISAAGKWIQRHKVFGDSFSRSPKLLRNVRKSIREVKIGAGTVEMTHFPKARANRFLIRITKGLLAHFYPEMNREGLAFDVHNATYHATKWREIELLRDNSAYDERGQAVFQFRRRVFPEIRSGYWMYTFYAASLFLVRHRPAVSQHSPD